MDSLYISFNGLSKNAIKAKLNVLDWLMLAQPSKEERKTRSRLVGVNFKNIGGINYAFTTDGKRIHAIHSGLFGEHQFEKNTSYDIIYGKQGICLIQTEKESPNINHIILRKSNITKVIHVENAPSLACIVGREFKNFYNTKYILDAVKDYEGEAIVTEFDRLLHISYFVRFAIIVKRVDEYNETDANVNINGVVNDDFDLSPDWSLNAPKVETSNEEGDAQK